MKKKIQTLVCLVLLIAQAAAQDTHFSQYTFSSSVINPAMTGAYKDLQATLQHKEQWRTVNAYRTSALTLEARFGQPGWIKVEKLTGAFKKKMMKGLCGGLHIFSDKAGDGSLKHTQATLNIAYHAMLSEQHTLS